MHHSRLQISPAWLAACLLSLLITAITWKLATRASITWRRESEALAKTAVDSSSVVPDVEQPLLAHEEASVGDGAHTRPSASARAIAPVAIPSLTANQSGNDHDEHHAHSPLAYSAVGSFTVGGSHANAGYASYLSRSVPGTVPSVFASSIAQPNCDRRRQKCSVKAALYNSSNLGYKYRQGLSLVLGEIHRFVSILVSRLISTELQVACVLGTGRIPPLQGWVHQAPFIRCLAQTQA